MPKALFFEVLRKASLDIVTCITTLQLGGFVYSKLCIANGCRHIPHANPAMMITNSLLLVSNLHAVEFELLASHVEDGHPGLK
jgi:hypothetical protein